jgi:16S rRNA U1498 N3-methylase RsmE
MNLILLKHSEIQSASSTLSSSQTENQQLIVHLTSKDDRAKHIANHLNKKSGETVSVGIIGGSKGKAIVQHQNGGGIRLEIQPDTLFIPSDEPEITLILAVPFPMRIKALWPVISSFSAVTRIVIVKGKKRMICGSNILHC